MTSNANATVTHKTISIDRIDPDPSQPRELFDETKLNELAASMKELGQLQAVTVRYDHTTRRYTLIMGERRWRAAQIAGITELHAMVMHGVSADDPDTFAKAMAENITRADMTPIEEGRGFKRLLDSGYDMDRISDKIGKSFAYITSRLDLLSLIPEVQDAVNKGVVSVGLAAEMAKLGGDAQAQVLRRWVRGEFSSGRDAIAYAQARAEAEKTAAEQEGMFVVEEPSEEQKAQIRAKRQQVVSKFDRLGMAGTILQEIVEADPEELALVLAGADGGIGGYKTRIEHLRTVAWRAMANLRKAEGIAKIRATAIIPDADTTSDADTDADTGTEES